MDKLQQLWQMAEDMEIFVTFHGLSNRCNGLMGLYIPKYPAIAIDNSLKHNYREQKCVFAEEIGHAKTFPRTDIRNVYKAYRRHGECNETIIMAQDERKALAWAADFLIPDVDLCNALSNGCRSCYDLSEYFEVSEWMIHQKIGCLRTCFRRQGLKVKGKDIFNLKMVSLDDTIVNQ
jgi:Zn-dependent peptidase ImmA (M78 family)